MAKVVNDETEKNGLILIVRLRVGHNSSQSLCRPVDKTMLLLESKIVQFPNEGSHTKTK